MAPEQLGIKSIDKMKTRNLDTLIENRIQPTLLP